jgi:hypothetical protein
VKLLEGSPAHSDQRKLALDRPPGGGWEFTFQKRQKGSGSSASILYGKFRPYLRNCRNRQVLVQGSQERERSPGRDHPKVLKTTKNLCRLHTYPGSKLAFPPCTTDLHMACIRAIQHNKRRATPTISSDESAHSFHSLFIVSINILNNPYKKLVVRVGLAHFFLPSSQRHTTCQQALGVGAGS